MTNANKIDQIKKYIGELELPTTGRASTTRGPSLVLTEDASAAVNAGSLTSFVSGITPTHKSDVLNSTLLAQLAANKQYNRFSQTMQWYDFYVSVLAQVGWVIPAFAFRQYQPSGKSLELSSAVLEILGAIATGNELAILAATLKSLNQNSSNENALTLFDQQSFPENIGTFQVFPVGEDDGQVVMALSAMQFRSEKHVTRFLWFSWTNTSVYLSQSAQKAILNEEVYGKVRQSVIEKLGNRAEEFIKGIEI